MSAIEKTLVLVKPDGVKKHICGEVISRFERKGLEVEAIKMIQVPEELAKKHYEEHEGKGFFKDLIAFITSGPVLVMVIKGENAVAAVRQINGATDPLKAVPGSIRGDSQLLLMKMSFMHLMLQKQQKEKSVFGSLN